MAHRIISTIGLGLLGVDPITAAYLLSMGLRKEKKSKITLFFLSFAGFSIFVGVALALMFGETEAVFLKRIMPGDNSPVWAVLNFAISVLILAWVFKKIFQRAKKGERQKKEAINGNSFKYISTGFIFAIASFTDPTFYAVVLIGGESGSLITAMLLLTIWFIVSQFMAVIVYVANELNLLNRLVAFVDKLKEKKIKPITYFLYAVLVIIAFALLIDTGFYLFEGRYLF